MPFLIIPNEAFGDMATIWVAAIDEGFDPAVTVLEYGSNQVSLNSNWSDFVTDDGQRRIRYQRVKLTNLQPRTSYNLTLRVGGVAKADGIVTTIPYRLPPANERPFIVMLGSCFYARADANGNVGHTFSQLPTAAKPDIKFLCGDQVYLDNPPQDFLNPFRGHKWLQARSFKTYADAWTQTTTTGGFARLLKHNANFFCSDDHEFWNNAPDVGLNVPLFTASQSGRDDWWQIGRQLYEIFQTSPGFPTQFKVEPLSFCIAETRFNRGPGGSQLMLQAAFEEIGKWARDLEGPGVLVVGQPFFASAHGTFGQIKDRSLPDYAQQYELLKQYLRAARHSIVVLTGDVHFGRLAVATLRPELGTKLYEVISSPMQLVPGGGGGYDPPPQVFGAITAEPEFSLGRAHFLTLEFTAPSAQRASMLVRFWPIMKNGVASPSQVIGKGPIELI
jgi:hypothetical protein